MFAVIKKWGQWYKIDDEIFNNLEDALDYRDELNGWQIFIATRAWTKEKYGFSL